MEALLKVALEKLDQHNVAVNQRQAILPQLMLTVFNEETPDNLVMEPSIREDLQQEVILLLNYSDKAVLRMLNLLSQERQQELIKNLLQAETDSQLREVLIVDLLYNAIQEMSEPDPD